MGLILMISGWALVPTALVLLRGTGQRLTFILAALAVEILGLVLLARAQKSELRLKP